MRGWEGKDELMKLPATRLPPFYTVIPYRTRTVPFEVKDQTIPPFGSCWKETPLGV